MTIVRGVWRRNVSRRQRRKQMYACGVRNQYSSNERNGVAAMAGGKPVSSIIVASVFGAALKAAWKLKMAG